MFRLGSGKKQLQMLWYATSQSHLAERGEETKRRNVFSDMDGATPFLRRLSETAGLDGLGQWDQ